MIEFKADKLSVRIFPDRKSMGIAVARDVSNKISELLYLQENLRMIFAAAPSQNEFLESVSSFTKSWERITAFHMDEYLGIDPGASQGFGNFLKRGIFGKHKFKDVHYLNPLAKNPAEECKRYAALLNMSAIDICAMGIGENGHIAFNDPPVADFNDPETIKIVELEKLCRQQQVNDGCFNQLKDVPEKAYTLTIPTLLASKFMYVTVPGPTKAKAVYKTLNDDISTKCPSTILRNYSNAILYLDKESASLLNI